MRKRGGLGDREKPPLAAPPRYHGSGGRRRMHFATGARLGTGETAQLAAQLCRSVQPPAGWHAPRHSDQCPQPLPAFFGVRAASATPSTRRAPHGREAPPAAPRGPGVAALYPYTDTQIRALPCLWTPRKTVATFHGGDRGLSPQGRCGGHLPPVTNTACCVTCSLRQLQPSCHPCLGAAVPALAAGAPDASRDDD